MKINQLIPILMILLLANLFFIQAASNTTNNRTIQTPQILDKKISNADLAILGVHEETNVKNIIVLVCLILMIIAILYDILKAIGFVKNNLVNFLLSIIIPLIGMYEGTLYGLTKYLSGLSNNIILLSKSSTLQLLLMIGLFVLASILVKFLIKISKKEVKEEKEESRLSELKTLAKLQEIEYASRTTKK